MRFFARNAMKRVSILTSALILSLSGTVFLVPHITGQEANAISPSDLLSKIYRLTLEDPSIRLETGIDTKSVFVHPEWGKNSDVTTILGGSKITVTAPEGLQVSGSASGTFSQNYEFSQSQSFFANKVAATLYFKATISGSYQVPISASFHGGKNSVSGTLSVEASRTPSEKTSSLKISKNNKTLANNTVVNQDFLSGNIVLNFDKV